MRISNTAQLETLQDLYGTARTYAEMLGDNERAKLLQTTLGEEAETDQKLTKLAKSSINVAAA